MFVVMNETQRVLSALGMYLCIYKMSGQPSGNRKRKKDELGQLLDRFSDPHTKAKKQVKRVKKQEEKRHNDVQAGKIMAVDCFNTRPTPEQMALWSRFVTPSPASLAQLEAWLRAADPSMIQYVDLPRTDGLFSVCNFITCAKHCQEWLDQQLSKIGWKQNMTLYNPVCVSHSAREVLDATIETYKMAIKQMQCFLTF